ncbi:MAG: hypothetical protein KDB07_05460 [Planctomycetes bacterium]|nr:hypothetical protein [Planctomycetota bacterium]
MDDPNQAPPSPEAASAEDPKTQAAIERAFLIAVGKAGVLAPDDALALSDLSALSLNDAGQVEGLDALIETMRTKRPYLFRASTSPGLSAPHPAGPSPSEQLRRNAQASGLTRDIHLWRQSKTRR